MGLAFWLLATQDTYCNPLPTEMPQWKPGKSGEPGWLPLSINKQVKAREVAQGRKREYAVDNYVRSWWEPVDSPQCMTVDLARVFTAHAARIVFANRPAAAVDKIGTACVAYEELKPGRVRHVRLTVTGKTGVIEFTVFGR